MNQLPEHTLMVLLSSQGMPPSLLPFPKLARVPYQGAISPPIPKQMCSAGGLLPAFPTCFATPNPVEMFAAVSVCTTVLHLYHAPSKDGPWTRFPSHFIMCSGRIRLPGSDRLCVCWVQDGEADKCQVNPEQGQPCTNNSAKQTGRNLKPDGTLCEGRTYISCACALGRPQWVFNGRVRPLALTENQQQLI